MNRNWPTPGTPGRTPYMLWRSARHARRITTVARRLVQLLGAALLAVSPAVPAVPVGAQVAPTTRIVVEPGDRRGPISPLLFGGNHRYPYNGFRTWDAAAGAAYPGFVAAYREAGFTLMRFPGGWMANPYHWQRAIGPLAGRGRNVDGITGEPQTNEFGPDEFGRFIVSTDTTGIIQVNFATGTAQEAADFVEYMNAPVGTNPNGGTAWAEVRAANGRREPYRVPYWEVGNELYLPFESYWLGDGASQEERATKYARGGTTEFTRQRAGTFDDHRDAAAVSDGSPSQVFYAKYPPVKPGSETVTVGLSTWSPVASLASAGRKNVYRIDPASGRIEFGDGTHGNVPPRGSAVTISYTSGPHDGFDRYYQLMKAADPTIKVCSAFDTREFLAEMGETSPYDCVVIHPYTFASTGLFRNDARDNTMLGADDQADIVALKLQNLQTYAGARAGEIEVVLSEYGLVAGLGGLESSYLASLDHALYLAQALQRWVELGISVAAMHPLADFSPYGTPVPNERGPAIEVITGPGYQTPPRGFVVSPAARAMRLFSTTLGTEHVGSAVLSNAERGLGLVDGLLDGLVDGLLDGKQLSALQAVASTDAAGTVRLIVVNRDRETSVKATVETIGFRPSGTATITTLNGPSHRSYNTLEAPNTVTIAERTVSAGPTGLTHTFPAHSVTAIVLPGAAVPLTGVLFRDTFEAEKTGSAPAGYALVGPAGSVVVAAVPAASGKALQISRGSVSAGLIAATRAVGTAPGRVRVAARVRAAQTIAPLSISLRNAGGDEIAMAGLRTWSTMAYSSGNEEREGPEYRAFSWHKIEIEVNPAAGTYDLYVDHAKIATASLSAAGPLASIQVEVPARPGAVGSFYVDDLTVFSVG